MSNVHAKVAGMYLVLASHLDMVIDLEKRPQSFIENERTSGFVEANMAEKGRKHHSVDSGERTTAGTPRSRRKRHPKKRLRACAAFLTFDRPVTIAVLPHFFSDAKLKPKLMLFI